MLDMLRSFLGLSPRDPLAGYSDGCPIIDMPQDEYTARCILEEARARGIGRIFVVAGAPIGVAHIARADKPYFDDADDNSRLLMDTTEEAGNVLVDWAANQSGLVEFDQSSGRMRRAAISLTHYQPWIQQGRTIRSPQACSDNQGSVTP